MADTVTLDDIEASSSRRNWLKYLGGGAGVAGVLWFLFGDVDARPRAWSVALDPNVTALSITDEGLRVTITGESDADEWLFCHEYQELDEAISTGEVPDLGGDVTVSLAGLNLDDYPTERFRFELVSLVQRDGEQSLDVVRESGVEFALDG